ncbi:MAG: NAD-dependent epimerase/dehydratase family protein [Desulfobulbaceae bacterium]|nr:NAD-dependent epimerase/dehydratase family protein [Desulfobulbaceae bacterium]
MKVLVTGASGFTGRHLVDFLNSKGCEVFSLGRTKVLNATHFPLSDVCDRQKILSVVQQVRPDHLFHLAGSTESVDYTAAFNVNTVFGTELLAALEFEGLEEHTRVLFVGSAAEYGLVSADTLPVTEKFCPAPYNVYGISKLAQTQMALAWGREGRKIVVVRPFTIMGPGMPAHLAIGDFVGQIKAILNGSSSTTLITGNIDVSRDFLHVSDIVDIYWRLVNAPDSYGKIVNVCSGFPLSLRSIVEYLLQNHACDITLEQSKDRMRQVDMETHYGDHTRLFDLIGEYQFTSWQRSLDEMFIK